MSPSASKMSVMSIPADATPHAIPLIAMSAADFI
jgi:hypothetical protein